MTEQRRILLRSWSVPLLIAAVPVVVVACAGDDDSYIPPPAPSGRGDKIEPTFVDFELPGPNLYFFCDGSYGVYVTEGSNNDSGKSAAPFVVADHHRCGGET